MYRLTGRKTLAVLAGAFLLLASSLAYAAETVTAGAQGAFNRPPESDWALGWMEAIFRGAPLPANIAGGLTNIVPITTALRQALSLYSIGMLVLAGFLMIYHVLAMIAETAHYGVAMGRRTNQLWAPIRFVLAIALLVPISGGLNAGQYIIVKLAESGSSLASNAWRGAVDTMKTSMAGFVTPRSPDATRLIAVGIEMEVCRSLYHQLYQPIQGDPAVKLAGDITDLRKLPVQRFVSEAWRYTNNLHANIPLCGAYRLPAPDRVTTTGTQNAGQLSNEVAALARAVAEQAVSDTGVFGDSLSFAFMPPSFSSVSMPDISSRLAALITARQQALAGKLRTMTNSNAAATNRVLEESADGGWVAAGMFIPDLTRQQATFGELAARAVPSVESPLFGHKALSRQVIVDAIVAETSLRNAAPAQLDKLFTLYDQMNNAMKHVRAWLYGRQLPNPDFVQADAFDLGDQLGPTTDVRTAFSYFTRLLDAGTVIYGVWAEEPQDNVLGAMSVSFNRDLMGNPLATMAEMGRRYQALGTWLLGMTSPGLAEPTVFPAALLFAALALGLGAAGFVLLFVLPLLPLLRFFLGVLVWFLEVFEAIVTLPLVALAHLSPAGDGLSGVTARQAYWLWLGLFIRPALTLFGFIFGLLLFLFAIGLLNSVFMRFTGPLVVANSEATLTLRISIAFLYVILAYVIINMSFKGIHWLPDRVLRWLNTLVEPAASAAAPVAPHISPGPTPAPAPLRYSAADNGNSTSTIRSNGTKDVSTPAESAHRMKAALFPTYRDPIEEPVVIPQKSVVASADAGTGGSESSATASSGGASATATAHATASVMAQNLPPADRREHPDILKAAATLAMLVEKQNALTDMTKPVKPKETKGPDGKPESPEQSSAPPEDETPS